MKGGLDYEWADDESEAPLCPNMSLLYISQPIIRSRKEYFTL